MMEGEVISMARLQSRVMAWMEEVFPERITQNREERGLRFLEEAIELAQSVGVTRERAERLVEYVYDRPVGHTGNEIGGVMITLAALSGVTKYHLGLEAENELNRISRPEVKVKIQERQTEKARDGVAAITSLNDGIACLDGEAKRREVRAPKVSEEELERVARTSRDYWNGLRRKG